MQTINPLLNAVRPQYQSDIRASVPTAKSDILVKQQVKPAPTEVLQDVRKPVISSAPKDLFSQSLKQIFSTVDADSNGLVTSEELTAALKAQGANEDQIASVIDNVLGATSDLNGDGLSLTELNRRIAADRGDAFAIADLNSDNQVTADELEQAIALYQKNGADFNASTARQAFRNSDFNFDNIVTRAEYVDASNGRQLGQVPSDLQPNKPISQAEFFLNLFDQVDADSNGLVTREELTAVMKANGASEDEITALLNNVLGATTDINGDGLSKTELLRRLEADAGNTFAMADLNSDGQVTADELDQAIALYNRTDNLASVERIRQAFASADGNRDGVLTQAEFNNYDPNNPAIPKVSQDVYKLFSNIFSELDADSNGLVTREEITKSLTAQGVSQDEIQALISNVLGATTDINGDGLSRLELQRRLAADAGDNFAAFDLNSDGRIGAGELEEAIKLYSQNNDNFDAARVRSLFGASDLNGNNELTRAEFVAYSNGLRKSNDIATDQSPAQIKPTAAETADINPALKPQIPNYSVATLNSDLLALLQDQQ